MKRDADHESTGAGTPRRKSLRPLLALVAVAGGVVLAVDVVLHSLPRLMERDSAEARPAGGRDASEAAGRFLQAVEYVADDYSEAVEDGKVRDHGEYEEQVEFLAKARDYLEDFPSSPLRDSLRAGLSEAAASVHLLAAPAMVEARLRALGDRLVASGLVPTAPAVPPDPVRGADLFAANCAACHGPEGRGDGPAGRALLPRPADFHDPERMEHSTPLRLFHAVRFGVEGTGMPSFAALPEADLWALALYVTSLGGAASGESTPSKVSSVQ